MGGLAGRHLLLVGPGYAARAVAALARAGGATVSATLRDPARAAALEAGASARFPAGPTAACPGRRLAA